MITRRLTSNALFVQLARTCSGDHTHVPLKGRVRQPDCNYWVFATKPAQVYPIGLAIAWSAVVKQIAHRELPQFAKSFNLVVSSSDRKHKLSDSVPWKGHRQEEAARLAVASG